MSLGTELIPILKRWEKMNTEIIIMKISMLPVFLLLNIISKPKNILLI